jgi:hypothetical protein
MKVIVKEKWQNSNPFFILIVVVLLVFLACQKNSFELPPVNVKPILNSIPLNYNGVKICDIELSRMIYADSNTVKLSVKNFSSQGLDSISILIYYFKSNSQVYDSVGFLPIVYNLNEKNKNTGATFYNLNIPANSQYLFAEILSYRKKTPASNIASGYYNGYTIQIPSSQAYKSSKGFITAEGKMMFWFKEINNTFRINALLPSDTTSMENIYLQDKDGIVATIFELDQLSANKRFSLLSNKFEFKIKNVDTASVLKTLKFNLNKNK